MAVPRRHARLLRAAPTLGDWLACARIGVAAARRAGDRAGQAWALDCLGHATSALGRPEDAFDCYQQARNIRHETGDLWGETANSTNNLGDTHRAMKEPGKAGRYYRQTLVVWRQVGNRHGEAETLRDLGDLSDSVGRIKAARQFWRLALAIADDLGDPRVAAEIRARLERR
jgi:tetratricopeptide (TPR) repeat protein